MSSKMKVYIQLAPYAGNYDKKYEGKKVYVCRDDRDWDYPYSIYIDEKGILSDIDMCGDYVLESLLEELVYVDAYDKLGAEDILQADL